MYAYVCMYVCIYVWCTAVSFRKSSSTVSDGHTKTLQLEVVKSKSGDKSVNVVTTLGTHSYGPFSTFPNDTVIRTLQLYRRFFPGSWELGKLTKSFPFTRLGSQFASSGVHRDMWDVRYYTDWYGERIAHAWIHCPPYMHTFIELVVCISLPFLLLEISVYPVCPPLRTENMTNPPTSI